MRTSLFILRVLIVGSFVGLPVKASEGIPVILGFEDLGSEQHHLPDNYAGLTWDSRWDHYSYLQWPLDPCSSGPARLIYGNWIDFGEDVTFLGSWIGTFAWGGDKYWRGYNDGILVYESPHLSADQKQHGWIHVYWTNVDYVEFVGSTGSYAIDDISYIPGHVLHAEIRIVPHVVNLPSKGKWMTCFIGIPEGVNLRDIDFSSVVLEHKIRPVRIWYDEKEHVVTARFQRWEIEEMLAKCKPLGRVEVTVIGELLDGSRFGGKDTIKVIE